MYVLLGSHGNITGRLATILLAQGHAVRVVGRHPHGLASLRQAGAEAAIGDLRDTSFLTEAMRGADAVYAMVPPAYASATPLQDATQVGTSIARAIADSGVPRVVNLSSIGAHLARGTGPIVGLHEQEQRLEALRDVSVLHLRPGYFYENHLNAVGVIRAHGGYADMIAPDAVFPSIATRDIAAVIARELINPSSTATRRVLHLHGPRMYSPVEAAAILGRAIGIPNLPYVQADPAQAKAGMIQHGISPAMADLFEEMAAAFGRPELGATLTPEATEITPTSLEAFAATFAAAYEAAGAARVLVP